MNYLQRQNYIRTTVMAGDPTHVNRVRMINEEEVRRQSIQWPEWFLNVNQAGNAGGAQFNQAAQQQSPQF